jgi:hypothetical protein
VKFQTVFPAGFVSDLHSVGLPTLIPHIIILMSATLPLIDHQKQSSLADFIAKYGTEYCTTAEEINQLRDAVNEMAVIRYSSGSSSTWYYPSTNSEVILGSDYTRVLSFSVALFYKVEAVEA